MSTPIIITEKAVRDYGKFDGSSSPQHCDVGHLLVVKKFQPDKAVQGPGLPQNAEEYPRLLCLECTTMEVKRQIAQQYGMAWTAVVPTDSAPSRTYERAGRRLLAKVRDSWGGHWSVYSS